MDLYTVSWIVLIYGFLGWCCEVIFAAVTTGKFVNRGFLNGPICPIYGFGMLIVLFALSPLEGNLFFLFLGAVILTSLLEFLTGFFLEKLFHQKWWDYTDEPFNLCGYICLRFSLLWGLGATFIIKLIHRPIALVLEKMPRLAGMILLLVLGAAFIADLVVTLVAILKLPKKFRAMNELEKSLTRVSDEIGSRLYEGTEKIMSHEDEFRGKVDELKTKKEDLEARYKDSIRSLSGVQRRFLKAFPNVTKNSKELQKRLLQLRQIGKRK